MDGDIGEHIMSLFYKATLKDMEEDRGNSIHVTDLVYYCLRHAYYAKQQPQYSLSREGILAVWIGKRLHETPLCERHEVELSYEADGVDIEGRIDELCNINGEWVIVDKKTTRNTPSTPHEHYVKQLTYYAWLAKQALGIEVKRVALLYINVAANEVKVITIPLTPLAVEQAGRELLEKAKILHQSLTNNTLPPRKFGWLCNYCQYFKRCVTEV